MVATRPDGPPPGSVFHFVALKSFVSRVVWLRKQREVGGTNGCPSMNSWQITVGVVAVVMAGWSVGASQRLRALRAAALAAFQHHHASLQRLDECLAAVCGAAQALGLPQPEQVLAASRQACAAAQVASERPLAPGPLRGLQLAEDLLERALAALDTTHLAEAGEAHAPVALMQSTRDQLAAARQRVTLARQDFNAAVANYNLAVTQFPTRLLAGPTGYTAILPLTPSPHAAEREPQRVQS